jgi:hypothetical protein
MADDLRTRIAKVIWGVFQNTPAIDADDDEWESWWNDSTQEEKALFYAQADAVIAKLGMHQEASVFADFADHEKFIIRAKVPVTRWVTNWKAVDE